MTGTTSEAKAVAFTGLSLARGKRQRAGAIDRPISAGTDQSQPGVGVSLWWAPLDVSASALRGLAACLSPQERQRADQVHRPLLRERFLAARGWLRCLLASEMRCAPRDVQIVRDHGGKPRLVRSDLHFSASRSGGIALYATSWRMEVGVDVEAIRVTPDLERIAARFFSQAEQRVLGSLAPAQRLAASFQCWTCKEAYGKGIGAGLDFSLPTVDVWFGGVRRARVFGWSVHQVDVAPGFAAAVAGAGVGEWVPAGPRRLDGGSSDWLPREAQPSCGPCAQSGWKGER